MLRRVHLHGGFKAFHDGPIEVFAKTVAEAILRVTSQLEGFRPDAIRGRKRIQVAGHNSIESQFAPSTTTDIHIFPAMSFAKDQGLIQTVIGFVLIVTAVLLFPYFPNVAIAIGSAGIGMVIGGVMQMLTPAPSIDKPGDRSKYIPAKGNTVRIGTPIPVLYGTYRASPHILSINIDARATNPS
jgi:predicted phage tail protein